MTRYAADTDVSASRSRDEIERTLTRYGATGFLYGWSGTRARVAFEVRDRHVRFELPLPDRGDAAFTRTPNRGTRRSPAAAEAAFEQAVRQRWRALALVVKAKLEAVDAGIVTFDEEFLAHIVVGEQTVGEVLVPQLEGALESHRPLELLPGSST
jgi:hypothetical protein